MTRNFKLAFLASAALTASGCVGAYHAPTGGNNGTAGGSTSGGGSGTAGGSGSAGGTVSSAGGTGSAGGGGGTTVPPPSNAQPMFDANVAPIIMADCSNSACHGNAAVTNPPPFASGTQANLYSTILNYADTLFPNFEPTTAPILTKIAAGHSGVMYSATDITNITNWLDAEKTARAGTTTASPRELLLEKFSGCMTQTDFDSAGVATAWANKTTNTTNTACQQCHVNASYFLANADSTRMFQILSTAANPQGGWFMEYFFTVDTTDPTNLKMAINRDYINQAATGLDQHEKFDIDTDKNGGTPSAYTRLTTFFNAAMAKMTAGTCGPSTLGTTPSP
jgi:hypothetical protein